MDHLTVTQKSINFEQCLTSEIEDFLITIIYESINLVEKYENEKEGLGIHSDTIGQMINELHFDLKNDKTLKRILRKVNLVKMLREKHVYSTSPYNKLLERRKDDHYLAGVMARMYESGYRVMRHPIENGEWKDNVFIPNPEYTPTVFNPDNKSFQQIKEHLKEVYNIEFNGIPFIEGFADFSSIALAQIDFADIVLDYLNQTGGDIASISDSFFRDVFKRRNMNLIIADKIAAERGISIPNLNKGYTARQLTKWRLKNRFTWDESYLNGYLLVPAEIHNNISHTGLVAIGQHDKEIEEKICERLSKEAPL